MTTLLQWGRSNYAAEISYSNGIRKIKPDASMGPQQLRCGNRPYRDEQEPEALGFNGAAAITLRK